MSAPSDGLPAPASWPILRQDRRLRFLVARGAESISSFQRIARRCNASLDVVVNHEHGWSYPVPMVHLNDKWIEAAKDPDLAEVKAKAGAAFADALKGASGNYDVIFCRQIEPELEKYVKEGGIWVVCGNVVPDAQSPLFPAWPAFPGKKNTWHLGGAKRNPDAPELSGLPLEYLCGQQWHGLYEVAEGAKAFSTGEAGAVFVRKLGKGTIVLVPSGPISRRHQDAAETYHLRYDHDEIWLRLWDQLLHGIIEGGSRLSVLADFRHEAKTQDAIPGEDYALNGRIMNLTDKARDLEVSLHIVSPSGKIVFVKTPEAMKLAGRERRDWSTGVAIPEEWGSGLYTAYLTVGDPAAKKQIHQAMELMSVGGMVKLELGAGKAGYKPGEKAEFKLKASSLAPWQGEISWGAFDFRGRLLASGSQAAELSPEAKEIPLSWDFRDHGVRVDTVWMEAAAVKGGNEYGRASAKTYKNLRWSMRNEYQWSTWAGIACLPPSCVPQAMRLMAHAGFNALGYPGTAGLHYPAERWSWRMYNEGVGSNTFSPVIESVTDEEIEAAQLKSASAGSPDLKSGALSIASVGEEAGFKKGWGHTYYWEEPVAPEKACQAFQRFLKEKYPSLETMNSAWGTKYKSWDEVKLTKEFSGAQPKIENDGWAHPKESPLGPGVAGVSLAPYQDSKGFYKWYYNKVVEAALKLFRGGINPVPVTLPSAPASDTFVPSCCDARQAGGSGWMECQQWSLMANASEPGFSLPWGHFDKPTKTEDIFWGLVITRSGHNDYWVDVPLMLNPDMSHTRASFAIRRWRHRTAHAERLLLDAVPAISEAGVLAANSGLLHQIADRGMANSVKIALNQGGFGFAEADVDSLKRYKIVFAIFHDLISKEEAEALSQYVEDGGTLVFANRFGGKNEYGIPNPVVPGGDLAEKWAIRITKRNDSIPVNGRSEKAVASLGNVDPSFGGLQISTDKEWAEEVEQNGWTELASYPTGSGKTENPAAAIPAILTRQLGKGRLVYLNATYTSQWYIQWVTPTDASRRGFYRLIEKLCADANARRTFRLDGDLSQALHAAALQWTDPSGKIGYVVARVDGEVPIWPSAGLSWLGSQGACYDIYGGDVDKPAPVYGRDMSLQFRPGAGKLLAFTEVPVDAVKATVSPMKLNIGQPLKVKVDILDEKGNPVPGKFPVYLEVHGEDGREIAGLRRDFSIASGESVAVQTALSDPAGTWTIRVRDGISRLSGTAKAEALSANEAASAPGFRPWGWPSENWEADRMTQDEFIQSLKDLAEVYRKDTSSESWMAKQWLGFYYCFFPKTRHALIRPLMDLDWNAYSAGIRKAVDDGAELILVGEDMGLDPATGLSVGPEGYGNQLEAVSKAMGDAEWETISADGEILRGRLGKGSIVFCRNTPDGAGHTWGDAVAWQKKFLSALANPAGLPIRKSPSAEELREWLSGRRVLVDTPFVADMDCDWEKTLDASKSPAFSDFVLRIPPTGKVKEFTAEITVSGKDAVRIDVGATGDAVWECKSGEKLGAALSDQLGNYLAWREKSCSDVERDLNGWRLVPIRFSSAGQSEVSLRKVTIVLE